MTRTLQIALWLLISASCQADDARQLFGELKDRIYQIRLMEQSSANKSSIGSGFLVGENGLIATNFHVVAGAAHDPEKYHLEYIDHQGQKGALELVDIDVVNDLALVRRQGGGQSIPVATGTLAKGDPVFSIGNPHDLGMTVVSGTYNGPVEHTYHGRLLFSGSLNPGMSGGPAINPQGQVIGVNVATSGDQLSFLVPADKLAALLQRSRQGPDNRPMRMRIQQQLLDSQQRMMDELLQPGWPTAAMGQAKVPGEIARFVRCWGDSNSNARESRYRATNTTCGLQEDVFLDDEFETGQVGYSFTWLEAGELNPIQFYARVQGDYGHPDLAPFGRKQHVEAFRCHSDFVAPSHGHFKAVLCARAYKDYPQLVDLVFVSTTLNDARTALVSQFSLSGVALDQGLLFAKRFVESVQWTSSSK